MVSHDPFPQESLEAQLVQRGSHHHPAGHLCQRDAGGLRHERQRPGGTRVGLDHVDLIVLDGVLDVDRSPHVEFLGDGARVLFDPFHHGRREVWRRDDAGAVPAVHPGLLDVLHDRSDDHLAQVVPDGVDIHLCGVLQEPVHQDRPLHGQATLDPETSEPAQLRHGPGQLGVVVDDLHAPAPQHVGGAHQHWIADPSGDGECPDGVHSGATGRLRDAQLGTQDVPLFTVLGPVDRLRTGPGNQPRWQRGSQLQRRLTTQRDDYGDRPLGVDHVGHVLGGQWLEVEAVAGVVVGGDGLRIAVHHDRLEAGITQGEAGVHAAVVELESLPDPVRTRSQDHHLGTVRRHDLVLVLPG